ncbi:glycerophosphoryl diester phosphodiesterase membrane domain-containing protein [Schaalia canis]|nr:glycerophosphoryl diester phosphodiesterase membrane domain-containing protein [Schaalia canis]
MTEQPRNDEPTAQGWQAPDSSPGYHSASASSSQWHTPAPNGGQGFQAGQAGSPYYAAGQSPYPHGTGPEAAPGEGYGGYASWAPAPQPGIIPLRPLNLGDLFDGTFRAIRSNPTVMFGFAVAVMAILSLITAFFTWYSFGSLFATLSDPMAFQPDDVESFASFFSSTLLTGLGSSAVNAIAIMILSGMLALTVTDAVLGRMTSIEHAWERIRPRVWKLLGLSLIVGLISVAATSIVVIAFVALGAATYAATESPVLVTVLIILFGLPVMMIVAFFVQVKLLFAPTVLAIEGQGVFASISRSFTLSKGSFWRVLGRLLLITLVTGFIGAILGSISGILQSVLPFFTTYALSMAIGTFLTGLLTAFLIPVSAAFQTLMYIDERMRKENLAPSLVQASQAQ